MKVDFLDELAWLPLIYEELNKLDDKPPLKYKLVYYLNILHPLFLIFWMMRFCYRMFKKGN